MLYGYRDYSKKMAEIKILGVNFSIKKMARAKEKKKSDEPSKKIPEALQRDFFEFANLS